jgi:3-hydroxyisobutyrate dehydrogenase-like beta-hydroxyacid dehydrogenase
MLKDLNGVDELAQERALRLPLAAAALAVYRRAAAEGLLQEDLSALIALYAPDTTAS